MNSLSLAIYAADTLGGLKAALMFGAPGLAAVASVGLLVSLSWSADVWSSDSAAVKAAKEAWPGKVFTNVKRLVIAGASIYVLGLVVPSQSTIMLIAASEVGETVLASKDVQSIGGEAGALATDSLKLLRKYVSEQLNGKAD